MKSHKVLGQDNIKGFTLIEIIIAVFVITMIGSLALFIGIDQYRNYALRAERDMIQAILKKARNQAMNNINEDPHGISLQASEYIVFQGSSYASRDPLYDESLLKSPAITTGGLTEVVFKQLRGDISTAPGDITVSNGIKTFTISINREGRIN